MHRNSISSLSESNSWSNRLTKIGYYKNDFNKINTLNYIVLVEIISRKRNFKFSHIHYTNK